MSSASPVPLSLRTQLTLPLMLLVACLLGSVALVQYQLASVNTRISDLIKASRTRLSTSELHAASSAVAKVSAFRLMQTDTVRQNSQRVLDRLQMGQDAVRNGILMMIERSVKQIVQASLLDTAADPTVSAGIFDREVEGFNAAMQLWQRSSSRPEDAAWAAEVQRDADALITSGRALQATMAEEAKALAALNRSLERERGTPEAVPDIYELQAEIALRSRLNWTRWLLTALACAGIGFGIVAVVNTRRRFALPVSHLVEVARDISNGRSRRRASVEETGEFAILARAFNQMMDARQQADEKLRSAHDSLELKVSARTAELWRANKALREESEQRARAERDFLQAQKMDALGKLAGSIAHDFNNLLTVIIGGAECVRKQLGAHHPAIQLLRTVQQAGERAAGLTRPLLTFSRNQVLSLEAVDLNEAAEEAGSMLKRLLGVNIDLRLNLAPDLLPVKANPNQIQQVLINLGVNGRDAMEGTGVLYIATRNAEVPTDVAERHGVTSKDRWVEIAVSDTGCGMDAQTKARIFEPFFTTKPAGKGTGLGLATVFGIVKQCGGFLDVESAPGEGTTFRVFIPATDVAMPEAGSPAPVMVDTTAMSGGETLLLVDDEDDIRELASMTLEDCGYRVLSAGNAEDAIVLAQMHTGEIRALITDVIMPGMTGVQLAGVLTEMIPGLRVLFVSGHTNETISEDLLLNVHADYLQKPYLGGALAAKVQGVLAGAQAQLSEVPSEDYAIWSK